MRMTHRDVCGYRMWARRECNGPPLVQASNERPWQEISKAGRSLDGSFSSVMASSSYLASSQVYSTVRSGIWAGKSRNARHISSELDKLLLALAKAGDSGSRAHLSLSAGSRVCRVKSSSRVDLHGCTVWRWAWGVASNSDSGIVKGLYPSSSKSSRSNHIL